MNTELEYNRPSFDAYFETHGIEPVVSDTDPNCVGLEAVGMFGIANILGKPATETTPSLSVKLDRAFELLKTRKPKLGKSKNWERHISATEMYFGIGTDHEMIYQEIGDTLGISRGRAQQMVQKMILELRSKDIREILGISNFQTPLERSIDQARKLPETLSFSEAPTSLFTEVDSFMWVPAHREAMSKAGINHLRDINETSIREAMTHGLTLHGVQALRDYLQNHMYSKNNIATRLYRIHQELDTLYKELVSERAEELNI